jgi:hypothetical protein
MNIHPSQYCYGGLVRTRGVQAGWKIVEMPRMTRGNWAIFWRSEDGNENLEK